ncbi:MAG: 50S ribosomal protein L23 [Flavobacteriales bacterium]|nr:50S ribosomal protein L23 [Bacteroidota bacterium]MCB9241144.1 50S ribosomal protein L23 [Flavobacteriales bacterium]
MGVIVKPLITEKSNRLAENLNQYAFVVDKDASKPQIIKEVEEMYGVNVENISTMIYRGKRKFRFTKSGFVNGKKPNFKKAIVSLKDDQTIDFFESV